MAIYDDYRAGLKIVKQYIETHDISAILGQCKVRNLSLVESRQVLAIWHPVQDSEGDSAWLWLGMHEMRQLFETGTFKD